MGEKIGYPSFILDSAILDKEYEGVSGSTFLLPFFSNSIWKYAIPIGNTRGKDSVRQSEWPLPALFPFQLEFDEEYFLHNILKLRRFEVLKEIRKVNQPVDKER